MAKDNKTALVTIALLAVVSAVGYIVYSLRPTKPNEGDGGDGGEGGDTPPAYVPPPYVPPAYVPSTGGGSVSSANSELATAYRAWANSTDILTKKYGKQSDFDLNAIGTANAWFDRSYAAGKNEYNAYLASQAKLTLNDMPNLVKDVVKASGSSYTNRLYGKNDSGNFWVRFLFKKDGINYQIYFRDNGTWKVYNPTTNKTVSYGKFTNSGKTLVVEFGVAKGETITDPIPANAAARSFMGTKYNPSYSDKAIYRMIADNIYTAVKGGGTYDDIFWGNIKKIKNNPDWALVNSKFGTKDGWSLEKWIKNDLEGITEKENWNFHNQKFNGFTINNNQGTPYTAKNHPSLEK